MAIFKNIARKILFPAIIMSGSERLISAGSKKRRQIIMFHGVVKKDNKNLSVNHISLENFRRQIKYLKENFEIVPLATFFSGDEKHAAQPDHRQIAITFDDGYENNYTNAFPVLREFNCPATIFVVTKCLENESYYLWYDLIDILKSRLTPADFNTAASMLSNEKKILFSGVTSFDELKSLFKKLNTAEKDTVLKPLFERNKSYVNGIDREFTAMLNKDQMKAMISSGLIEIGSHTHTHPNLSEINSDDAVFELKKSKELLEANLGTSINSIAFPDGSYNDAVKKFALDEGYKHLLAVDYKMISDQADKNILPRYCISNTTTAESNIIQIHKHFADKGF
jgi:peptidoglycan/xylan/chitin deacetylase (PgdA/CDA1 family)